MNDLTQMNFETALPCLSDDPADWGPRMAPLEMPRQMLEPAERRFDQMPLLRALLPRERI